MKFDYLCRVVLDASIEIDDIGNCVIRASNDRGEEFYLVIKTSLGWSEIFEYGPSLNGIMELPNKVIYSYRRIEYDQKKLITAIDKFLNDAYKSITQVEESDIEDIKPLMKNISDYL